MTENVKSCAVAFPSKRNAQLSPLECATDSATDAQQNSLKAASLRILERNKARNTCATDDEKTAQLWGEKTGSKVARVAQHSSDEIHQAVLLMAAHWQYTPDDLAYVLTDSASDPQGWLPILYAEGWLVKPTHDDHADAISCGQTYCGDCRNYRGDDRTCSAKKCPTPLTLYRRCDLYKARGSTT